MMQKATIILSWIALFFVAQPAIARLDQSGYPARCLVYQVCKDEQCLRPIAYGNMLITTNNDVYKILFSGSGNRTQTLHFFDTNAQARRAIHREKSKFRGLIAIPNEEVADAFGLDLYPVRNLGHDDAYLGETVTKVACSRVLEGTD